MSDNYYLPSIILAIISIFIICALLITDDILALPGAIIIFTPSVFFISLITRKVSEKILQIGDRIESLYLKIIYYLSFLLTILLLSFAFVHLLDWFSRTLPSPNSLAEGIGFAVIVIFLEIIFFIFLIVPYIQALILLILRKIKYKTSNYQK